MARHVGAARKVRGQSARTSEGATQRRWTAQCIRTALKRKPAPAPARPLERPVAERRSCAERCRVYRDRTGRNCSARRPAGRGDAAVRKLGSVPETKARGNAAARRHSDRYHSRTVTTRIDDQIRSRQRYCSRRDPGVKRIDGTTARDVRECTARPNGLLVCIGTIVSLVNDAARRSRQRAAGSTSLGGLDRRSWTSLPRAARRRGRGPRPAAAGYTRDPTSHARSDRSGGRDGSATEFGSALRRHGAMPSQASNSVLRRWLGARGVDAVGRTAIAVCAITRFHSSARARTAHLCDAGERKSRMMGKLARLLRRSL